MDRVYSAHGVWSWLSVYTVYYFRYSVFIVYFGYSVYSVYIAYSV